MDRMDRYVDVELDDIIDGIIEIAQEENLPTDSWEEFSRLMEHYVVLYEAELLDHPDYDRAVRAAFEKIRREQ